MPFFLLRIGLSFLPQPEWRRGAGTGGGGGKKRIGFSVRNPDILNRRCAMFKRMQRGASLVEWIVVVVIVVGILGAAALTIVTTANTRAGTLSNWIEAIPEP
jgi:hypothetical protein